MPEKDTYRRFEIHRRRYLPGGGRQIVGRPHSWIMYFTLKRFASPTKCASPTINPWRRHCYIGVMANAKFCQSWKGNCSLSALAVPGTLNSCTYKPLARSLKFAEAWISKIWSIYSPCHSQQAQSISNIIVTAKIYNLVVCFYSDLRGKSLIYFQMPNNVIFNLKIKILHWVCDCIKNLLS